MAQEPSGFRCGWFSHPFSLLIPTFALRFAPGGLPVTLLRYTRTLPYHCGGGIAPTSTIRGFGAGLEPRVIVGAGTLDQ